MRILITAGPTVEDIDPVRFISNRASGTLGCLLAKAALEAGHLVTLIHGPIEQRVLDLAPPSTTRVAVRSAAQMLAAVMKHVKSADAVIMNAAVADYTPDQKSTTKLKKSGAGLTLKLKPTVDILKRLGEIKKARKKRLILIGFALETGEGKTAAARKKSALEFARKKLESKNLDAIVINSPKTIGAADGDFQFVLDNTVPIEIAGEKEVLAGWLITRLDILRQTK